MRVRAGLDAHEGVAGDAPRRGPVTARSTARSARTPASQAAPVMGALPSGCTSSRASSPDAVARRASASIVPTRASTVGARARRVRPQHLDASPVDASSTRPAGGCPPGRRERARRPVASQSRRNSSTVSLSACCRRARLRARRPRLDRADARRRAAACRARRVGRAARRRSRRHRSAVRARVVDGPGVEALVELHHAHAGLGVAREHGALDGCRAAPARQQREVQVHEAEARRVEQRLREELSERDDHPEVGVERRRSRRRARARDRACAPRGRVARPRASPGSARRRRPDPAAGRAG